MMVRRDRSILAYVFVFLHRLPSITDALLGVKYLVDVVYTDQNKHASVYRAKVHFLWR